MRVIERAKFVWGAPFTNQSATLCQRGVYRTFFEPFLKWHSQCRNIRIIAHWCICGNILFKYVLELFLRNDLQRFGCYAMGRWGGGVITKFRLILDVACFFKIGFGTFLWECLATLLLLRFSFLYGTSCYVFDATFFTEPYCYAFDATFLHTFWVFCYNAVMFTMFVAMAGSPSHSRSPCVARSDGSLSSC
jgi:hypothetical protein